MKTNKRGRPRGGSTIQPDGKRARTYLKWGSMIQRCENKQHPAYRYYGGKGIKVCELWRQSYKSFLDYMGEVPPGMWLDRIDNNKDYMPGNCRWVTTKQSAANRKPRQIIEGSLRDKARKAGLSYHLVYQRIKIHGWEESKALSLPPYKQGCYPRYN